MGKGGGGEGRYKGGRRATKKTQTKLLTVPTLGCSKEQRNYNTMFHILR